MSDFSLAIGQSREFLLLQQRHPQMSRNLWSIQTSVVAPIFIKPIRRTK
jgi:hypothetical protein